MPKMEEFKQRISTLFRDTEGNIKRIHEITKSINNCLWEVENKGGGQKSRTRIWGVCACVCLHKSSNIWLSKPFENVIFIFFTWNLKQKLIKILNRKMRKRKRKGRRRGEREWGRKKYGHSGFWIIRSYKSACMLLAPKAPTSLLPDRCHL